MRYLHDLLTLGSVVAAICTTWRAGHPFLLLFVRLGEQYSFLQFCLNLRLLLRFSRASGSLGILHVPLCLLLNAYFQGIKRHEHIRKRAANIVKK